MRIDVYVHIKKEGEEGGHGLDKGDTIKGTCSH